jgi:hypothetical protein
VTLSTFSQTVTISKDTLVPVSLSQLRKAMYDLQMYDVCKQETHVQDSLIHEQDKKIDFQSQIIITQQQVDSMRVSQMQDLRHISALKDTKINILLKDITKQKKITAGVGILGILGIILL